MSAPWWSSWKALEWVKSLGTRHAPIPHTLYKYRAVNEFCLRILSHSELYFSDPIDDFNDPFDCRLPLDFHGTKRQWLDVVERVKGPALTSKEAQERESQIIRQMRMESAKSQDWHQWQSKLMDDILALRTHADGSKDRVGVLSLTDSRNNHLLWAHYADGHQGVCFGFSTSAQYASFYYQPGAARFLDPVSYPRKYRPVNRFTGSSGDQVRWALFTKLPEWKYEKEWRVFNGLGSGPQPFSPAMLTQVVLGSRMSRPNRDLVMKLARSRQPRPRIYEANTKDNRLVVSEISV